MTNFDTMPRCIIGEECMDRLRAFAAREDLSPDTGAHLPIARDYIQAGGQGPFEDRLVASVFADVLGEVLDRLAEVETELEELRGQHLARTK